MKNNSIQEALEVYESIANKGLLKTTDIEWDEAKGLLDEALTLLKSGKLVVDGERLEKYVLNRIVPCPLWVDPQGMRYKKECEGCIKNGGDCADKAKKCIRAYLQGGQQ